MPKDDIPVTPDRGSKAGKKPASLKGWTTQSDKTGKASWDDNLLEGKGNSRGLPKFIKPAAMVLALAVIGLIIWNFTIRKPGSPGDSTTQNGDQPDWVNETSDILTRYLNAVRQNDVAGQLRMVTDTSESRDLIPGFTPPPDSYDVLDPTTFVAKPLAKAFTDHGIYLMYYQKPGTHTGDTIFSPILPLPISPPHGSAALLEALTTNVYSQQQQDQKILAFFKRGKDDRVTLDWPIFVQTRYRQLARFTSNAQPGSRKVFRLMASKIHPTLVTNVYDRHLADHDWYRIHCPAYENETHIVAVARDSDAGNIMRQNFDLGEKRKVNMHALTAELTWNPSQTDGTPVLCISRVVSWEFSHLNPSKKP